MKTIISILFLASFNFLLWSCEGDDKPVEKPTDWNKITLSVDKDDNGIEQSRIESTYDSKGRLTGSSHFTSNVLTIKYIDFKYEGYYITYHMNTYNGGNIDHTYKYQATFFDNAYNMDKLDEKISFTADSETEQAEILLWEYDNRYREINSKRYYYGTRNFITRSYSYSGLEVIFYKDIYNSFAELIETHKCKRIYYNTYFRNNEMVLDIEYTDNIGTNELTKSEWLYDSEGRVTGHSKYESEDLVYSETNFVYTEKERTFTKENLIGGVRISIYTCTQIAL